MRLEELARDLVGDLAVILRLDAVLRFEQLHVGVGLLLPLDGTVGPLVVRGVGDVADHRRVETLFAHRRGEVVHDERTVGLVVEGLDVVHRVLLAGALVGDHDDAGVERLLEDVLDRGRVDRDDADRVDVLRDEVLNDLRLHRGIGVRRPALVDVHAGVVGVAVDALFHAHEPGVRGVLRNDRDRVVAVARLALAAAGVLALAARRAGGDTQSEHRDRCDRRGLEASLLRHDVLQSRDVNCGERDFGILRRRAVAWYRVLKRFIN